MENTDATPKRKFIVVGVNSLTEIQYPAYNAHIGFFYRCGRDVKDYDFILVNPSRVGIDRMRNLCCEVAIKYDAEYVLFLDDDVLIPPDGLSSLLKCGADIAAGDVLIRGYPFNHMAFKYSDALKGGMGPLRDYSGNGSNIEEVDAVGNSFTLIRTDIIKLLKPPYFHTGPNYTEDIYFCIRAREAKADCKIVVDKAVLCAHILWPEVITSHNREMYQEYYEKLHPEVIELPKDATIKLVKVRPDVEEATIIERQIKGESIDDLKADA
jgi:hypothetical protein